MNKQESDILNALLLEPFINQRILAEVSGHSLGVVNRSLKELIKAGYLNEAISPTAKAVSEYKNKTPKRAIILAAGFGMRMVPINTEMPKGLLEVNGEPLIERIIKQLHEVGIQEIYVVVGFMKEKYEYLMDEYGVELVVNPDYASKNNLHSLKLVKEHMLSGSTLVIQEDPWGHRNILSKCNTGDFFGEPYAATPGAILNISVVAEEDCEILLLNVKRLLTSCPTACDHHQKLIRNLVSVLANKILLFNDKITHVSKRTTREKLLSYLSAESIRQSSLSFDIPFDRQQLADFLCVERAAMSAELSKLQKEGLLVTKRNHFQLLTR